MRKSSIFAPLLFGSLLVVASASPAQAATGEVVAFKTDLEPVDRVKNPQEGECHEVAGTSHVVINLTDTDMRLYFGPGCVDVPFVPNSLTIEPDHAWHAQSAGVEGTYSFEMAG